jgi:hypothetical protein
MKFIGCEKRASLMPNPIKTAPETASNPTLTLGCLSRALSRPMEKETRDNQTIPNTQ